MTPILTLTETADAAVREVLLNGILRFSEQRAGPAQFRPLVLLMSDADSAAVIGGLWGRTSWSFLYVELLYVPDLLRGQGFGSRLLRQAEEEGIEARMYGRLARYIQLPGTRLLSTARLHGVRRDRGLPTRPQALLLQEVPHG